MDCKHQYGSLRQNQPKQRHYQLIFSIMVLFISIAWVLSGCSSTPNSTTSLAAEEQQIEAPIQTVEKNSVQSQTQEQAGIGSAAPLRQKQAAEQSEAAQVPALEAPASEAQTVQATLPPTPTLATSPAATQPAADLPPAEPKVGFLAPDITLNTLDGSAVKLSDLRGKNVLISYWVTWCIPCQEELPALSRLSQEFQGQNLVILTVNGIKQDELGKVQQAVADMGLTNPVLLDEGEAFWNTYMVQFLPTSFYIDSQGIIRHIQLGSAPEDKIRAKVDQLINNQF